MTIEVTYEEEFGYSVSVNGETVLECMSEDELQEVINTRALMKMYNMEDL